MNSVGTKNKSIETKQEKIGIMRWINEDCTEQWPLLCITTLYRSILHSYKKSAVMYLPFLWVNKDGRPKSNCEWCTFDEKAKQTWKWCSAAHSWHNNIVELLTILLKIHLHWLQPIDGYYPRTQSAIQSVSLRAFDTWARWKINFEIRL